MGCNQSSARTTPSASAAGNSKLTKPASNLDRKSADDLEEEARRRRQSQGKVENMVHEEFERGYFLCDA